MATMVARLWNPELSYLDTKRHPGPPAWETPDHRRDQLWQLQQEGFGAVGRPVNQQNLQLASDAQHQRGPFKLVW